MFEKGFSFSRNIYLKSEADQGFARTNSLTLRSPLAVMTIVGAQLRRLHQFVAIAVSVH